MAAPYKTFRIRPVAGGLNDEVNPLLIADDTASDLSNVEFDKLSIASASGHTKINRDPPKSAGLRVDTTNGKDNMTPLESQPPVGGFVVLPYKQTLFDSTKSWQWDISFRIEGPGLKPGEFVSLLSSGGGPTEHFWWSLGYARDLSSTNTDEVYPCLLWWDNSKRRLKFWRTGDSSAKLSPGVDYHLSARFDKTSTSNSKIYLNGVALNASEATGIDGTLPLTTNLELTAGGPKNAMYLLRVPDTGGQTRTSRHYTDRSTWGFQEDEGLNITSADTTPLDSASETIIDADLYGIDDESLENYLMVDDTDTADNPLFRYISNWDDTSNVTTLTVAWPESTDKVRIQPRWRPVLHSTTIGEVRLWHELADSASRIQALMGKELYEKQTDASPYNLLTDAEKKALVAYWPCNDDGGNVVYDIGPLKDHGFLAPGAVARSDDGGFYLDGTSTGVYLDFSTANLTKDLLDLLGGPANDKDWYAFVRLKTSIGNTPAGLKAAGTYDNLHTLFSWDTEADDGSWNPLFEGSVSGRLTQTTSSRMLFLRSFVSATGEVNTEAVTAALYNPGEEITFYLGFKTVGKVTTFYMHGTADDPSSRFDLTATDTAPSDRDPFDILKSRLVIGGRPQADGNPGHAPSVLALKEVGWSLGTLDNAATNELIILEEPTIDKDTFWRDLGGDSKIVDLTDGSASVVSTSGGKFPTDEINLTKWPIVFGDDKFVEEDLNKPAIEYDTVRVVDTHAADSLTLSRNWNNRTRSGVRARVPIMLSFTDLSYSGYPRYNAVIETDSTMGKTPNVFTDMGPLGGEWGLCSFPARPGHPYEQFHPYWWDGLTTASRPHIDGLGQYKTAEGDRQLISASRGTVYHVDDRWDVDHPTLTSGGYSYRIRNLLPEYTDRYIEDGIEVVPKSGKSFQVVNDGIYQWEAWVNLSKTDGTHTVASVIQNATGDLKINHHLFIRNGMPTIYLADNSGTPKFIRLLAGKRAVKAGEWVHLVFHLDATPVNATGKVAINGVWHDLVEKETSRLACADIPTFSPEPSLIIGAYGSAAGSPAITRKDTLDGLMCGFRMLDITSGGGYSTSANILPAVITGDGPTGTLFTADMQEGKDIYFDFSPTAEADTITSLSRHMVPLKRGLGRVRYSDEDSPYSFAMFHNRLYGTNGKSMPFRYDGETLVEAGLQGPLTTPNITQESVAQDIHQAGYHTLLTGVKLDSGTPELDTATGLTEDMVGWLVVGAASRGRASSNPWGQKEYVGTIASIVDATEARLYPVPTAYQKADSTSVMLFEASLGATPTTAELEAAIAGLKSNTPYSDIRLIQDGDGTPATGTDNEKALHFEGNHYIDIVPTSTLDVGVDKVLDFMCYIRWTDLVTDGDQTIPILQRRDSLTSSSYVIEMFNEGKVRFKFFDESLGKERSIETTGRIFTTDEWYFFRFRYKFKKQGTCQMDTSGGWEYDSRYWYSDTGATAPRGSGSNYRDGLWCWALEGKNPADAFLVAPGCHSCFDQTNTHMGRSTELGNTGALLSAPYVTPGIGTPDHNGSVFISGGELDLLEQTTVGSRRLYHAQDQTNNFHFPRWLSRFRHKTPTSGGDGAGGSSPHLAAAEGTELIAATGNNRTFCAPSRAMLLKITGPAGNPNLNRIFAIEDLGVTDDAGWGATPTSADIDSVDVNGGNDLTLSDDPALGADGGGAATVGATNLEYVIYFPTGKVDTATVPGHHANATGNTSAIPTLLVQGTNPVGDDDHPTESTAHIHMLGTSMSITEGLALRNAKCDVDDLAIKIVDLAPGTGGGTADCMAAQTKFRGPTDTNLYSLPPLDFGTTASESTGAGATGKPTISFRFDTDSGVLINKDSDSDDSAPPGTLALAGDKLQPVGKHKFRVTFYDPNTGVESNPGPEVFINSEGTTDEESTLVASNPFVLSDLPIAPFRNRDVYRRLYKTLTDGGLYFLAKEVEDNLTREVLLEPSQVSLGAQKILEIDNYPPPVCEFLAPSEVRMFYGGIKEAPLTVRYSDAFQPGEVPGLNELVLESPEGNPVSGLSVVFGDAVIFKRDSLFRNTTATGAFLLDRIESGIGAVSHASLMEVENVLYFISEKGLYSWSGGNRVRYLSHPIEATFLSQDVTYLKRSSTAYHRSREQILFTLGSDKIMALEIRQAPEGVNMVFSLHTVEQGVDLLASMDDLETDRPVPIMGTPGGYVVRYDSGTHRMTNPEALYGDLLGAVSGTPSTTLAATGLTLKGDMTDVPYITVDSTGVKTGTGVIHSYSESGGTTTITPTETPSGSANTDVIHIGGFESSWSSRWFDAGLPDKRKFWHGVTITHGKNSGNIRVRAYVDFDDATAVFTEIVDASSGFLEFHLKGLRAQLVKFVLDTAGAPPLPMEVFDISINFIPADQR